MNTPTLHSLLRWCWTRRFPVLFTAVVTGLLMPSFSASPPGNSRKVIDLRTGKTVENVLADGTIYQFQATVPKVNLWQVPLPLEGVWIESADKSTLTWISSHSGGSGDSTDCGGAAGGAAGDCPTNNPTCGGVAYDPVTEGCCNGVIFDLATEVCCDNEVESGQSCPRCDNPHTLNMKIFECYHLQSDTNGTPCSTTKVIENILVSATCDFHPTATGSKNCNVKVGEGVELVQIYHKNVSCPGGNVNWQDWITIYIGCGSECGPSSESPYQVSCVTSPTTGSYDGSDTRGQHKVIGCP